MAEDLEAAFIFVPHGHPPPLDWMRRHPDWIKIPALMVPHETGEAERQQAIADFQSGRRYRTQGDDAHPDMVGSVIRDERHGPTPATRSTDPGVVVHFPDGRTIPDPYDPENQLRAPISSLDEVAKAGRRTGRIYQILKIVSGNGLLSMEYFVYRLLEDVATGGNFDYQREGNIISGFIPHRQFRDVSNFDVGLYCQQAGLSEEETL